MVRITEDLIRKRSEHNEMIISTLEEVSLHQQDIEKIEYIDKWCRDLKILYLQSNLIPKIENVGRLKKLEYLNLALNNIEKIENLEGCESLKKLDLTVNFVYELTNVENLKKNIHFRQLYLNGNPCTDFEGYRDFVIATLPHLEQLDGVEIEKSERILAVQRLPELRPLILQQQENYRRKREKEKREAETGQKDQEGTDWYSNIDAENTKNEEKNNKEKDKNIVDEDFWNETTAYTPESRIEVHRHLEEARKKEELEKNPPKPKKERRLQDSDGRIYNVNEAKVDFDLTDDDENIYLNVKLFKYIDTSLCDVDVHPTYIKVLIKGQLLQLVLPEEVKADAGSAKRSQTTGHLLLTMPKLHPVMRPAPPPPSKAAAMTPKLEKLEIDPSRNKPLDLSNIVKEKPVNGPLDMQYGRQGRRVVERSNSEGFVDDEDVPPLM